MRRIYLFLILLFVVLNSTSASWMQLGLVGIPPPLQNQQPESKYILNPDIAKATAVCEAIPNLPQEQTDVCQKHPNLIYPVADGAYRGIQECQYQFRNERWNCTTNVSQENVFGYVMKIGSKETAFIYAVTSAGVAHAVTQSCSSGELTECSCDTSKLGKTTPQGWKWAGCSDNIDYGIEFARKFVDAPEQMPSYAQIPNVSQERIYMNLHNNEVGRLVVLSLMRMHCRCHGVSGSCELKTCWRMMPSFNEVGDLLKKKYNQAVLLPHLKSNIRSKRHREKEKITAKKSDLIHIRKSPNYCKHNKKKGILGTKGRRCEKKSGGSDSCDILCCGRGHDTQVVRVQEKCRCKFVWCCSVKCSICEKETHSYYCK